MIKKRNKLQLLVGKGFESLETEWSNPNNITADVINAANNVHKNKTRAILSYGIVGTMFVFVMGAAIIGLITGTFGVLQIVWAVVGPILGMICSYYYRTSGGLNEPEKYN